MDRRPATESAVDTAEIGLADWLFSTDLSGLEAPNVDPEGLEGAGVTLSLSPGEHVDRGHKLHVDETSLLNGV